MLTFELYLTKAILYTHGVNELLRLPGICNIPHIFLIQDSDSLSQNMVLAVDIDPSWANQIQFYRKQSLMNL